MTTPVRILILVLVSLFATSALTQTQRYEFKHSFRAPFYLGRGGTLPFWEFGGSAIVSEDRIRLTPAIQSRVGWVWNSVAADMDAWEVQLDFEIGGGGSRGADGMALWYVAEPKQEGTSMGSKDEFNGMAVFFDTFDNDGQNDEPRISLWVNDGTQRYNPFDDGKHGERGSCSNLNREARSKMRVIYRDGIIQVETDNDGHWVPCITAHHTLPRGFYFGLSAATGHLTDNHDVYSFITYNLDPWRRRPPVPAQESPEVQHHEEQQQQQQEQQQEQQQQHHEEQQQQQQQQHHEEQNQTPEPVKPNPYLPKDAPNPYLPRKQVQQQEEHHQQQQQSEQAHNGGEQTEQQQQQQHNYQEQQQQHQEQQPRYQQEEMDKLAAKLDQLTFKVEAVRNQQDSLAHSLSQVLDKANGLQQQLQQSQPQQNQDRQAEVAAEVSGELRAAMQEIRSVQNAVEDVRRLVQDDINQMGKTVTDLKNHISSEQGNTYNNVARLVRELQQHVSSLQVLVERGDRDQNSALQELKSGKEELKTVVEKSGSVAWWIYFCFFQACFGVAYVIWRKTRDDANKKFL